ncbi:GPP34 family phosphoprotein [Streptomyces sp. NPDC050418]|uniref:GOLPH3/VPS74 family protein n=1 Tax=Streptomyces sp. NPDC050418 TaxID=3365612 RepID=UPI00379CCA8C
MGSLSLPVQLYLLAYDTTQLRLTGTLQLPYLVRAGALTELVQQGNLVDRDGTARVVEDARTGDPVLDGVLDLIGASRPRSWRAWAAMRTGHTLAAVRGQLAQGGYLRTARRRSLGVFPYTEYALDRADFVDSLRAELLGALRGRSPLDEVSRRDATLIALCAAAGLRTLAPARDHRERLTRLAERSGAGAPGRAVQEVRRSMVLAIASVTGEL